MKRYQDFILNRDGHPVANAAVSVLLAGTETLATLYSDDGITETTNPALSDANGFFYFYVADGSYDLAFSGNGLVPWTIAGEEIVSVQPDLPGVFTNTQANIAKRSLLGGLTPSIEWGTQQVDFTTDAMVGGVSVPESSDVHQANAFAGYVANDSTDTYGVALYGQARLTRTGAKVYGLNTVTSDTEASSGDVVGVEIDINVRNASSSVYGLSILGGSAAQPTGIANAITISGLGVGINWQNGIVFAGGATANTMAGEGIGGAIVLNQEGADGDGHDSQQILFNSSSRGAMLRLRETQGDLYTNVPLYAPELNLGAIRILTGAVDPSAASGVAAPQGSLYLRTNGAAATSLYVKTGAGDTAWTAK